MAAVEPVEPMVLGMVAEELYGLLNDHAIQLTRDRDEWSRAVQRKLGQLLVLTGGGLFDEDVAEKLVELSKVVPRLEEQDDQMEARSELAAEVKLLMAALATRLEGAVRAEFYTGLLVKRIGQFADAASGMDGPWWREHPEHAQNIEEFYREQLQHVGGKLRDSIPIHELAPARLEPVRELIELAVSGERFSETHELAERIMAASGFSSEGPLALRGAAQSLPYER